MPVRRLKTHAAQTGYVYRYYFVGKRPALPEDPDAPAQEYVFDVTVDGTVVFAVSLLLQAEALAAWALAHGRVLTAAEEYAAAKLGLLRELDEMEAPATHARRKVVGSDHLELLVAELALDE